AGRPRRGGRGGRRGWAPAGGRARGAAQGRPARGGSAGGRGRSGRARWGRRRMWGRARRLLLGAVGGWPGATGALIRTTAGTAHRFIARLGVEVPWRPGTAGGTMPTDGRSGRAPTSRGARPADRGRRGRAQEAHLTAMAGARST